MKKYSQKLTGEALQKEYRALIKKISDEDLRDILSILLCDPEVTSANLFVGKLDIEKLDEKDRAYHLNNSAKLQSFEKDHYEELYSKLKDEFRIFEKEYIVSPILEQAPDILKSTIEETKSIFPKVSLLINMVKSALNLRTTGKELSNDQTINLIECFTSEDTNNSYTIVINEDYLHPLKLSRSIKIWSMFFDLIQNGSLDRNDTTQDLYDYLNYNPNNKITTNTKYPRQVIIEQDGSSYKPLFKTSIQTEKALIQRQNKIKTST